MTLMARSSNPIVRAAQDKAVNQLKEQGKAHDLEEQQRLELKDLVDDKVNSQTLL